MQVNLAIEEVGRRLANKTLSRVTGFPACGAAAHEAAFHGLPLVAADQVDKVWGGEG